MDGQLAPVRVFASEALLRQTAVDIARFACELAAERERRERMFDELSVARLHLNGNADSGDLPNFVLKLLGVRDPRLVARDGCDAQDGPWDVGRRTGRIVFPKSKLFVWAKLGLYPEPGDIVYAGSPEYVCVFESMSEWDGTFTVFEQGHDVAPGFRPMARRRTWPLLHRGSVVYIGNSRVRGWLVLSRIPGILRSEPAAISHLHGVDGDSQWAAGASTK